MKDNFVKLLIIFFSHTALITFFNLCEITKTTYNLRRRKHLVNLDFSRSKTLSGIRVYLGEKKALNLSL